MSLKGNRILSGEPLPVAPQVGDPEIEAFHRKLLDYLRRLTAKIARFSDGGGPGTLVFSAILSADVDLPESGGTDYRIPFDTELRKDSAFTFSSPSHFFGVTEAGFYVLELDTRVLKNIPMVFYLAEVDGSGEPATVIAHSFTSADYITDGSNSFMVPFVTTGAVEIGIFIVYDGSIGGNDVYANGTRLLVTKYEPEVA